jgi:gliding motility-associated-like protein
MPVAAFDIAPINCETQSILFTDASQANEGTITQWAWDFGDAANSTTTNPNTSITQNPQHVFKTAGTYTVGLTVTSSTGCTSFITNQVIVHPQPQVDFVPPDVCISDAFAVFKNTSTIADGTEADFEYTWDFGDKNATTANNASKAINPKHTYTEANVYTATLTVKSKYGCEVTTSHTFTVNGATPKAAFATDKTEVPNTFCSSDDVLFKDKSTVDFGIVTKIEWYFDFNNHPNDVTVYTKDQFPADRIFRHNYGLFNNTPSQTYHVKMIVYSGGICQNTFEDDVTIYANPLIDVSPINATNTLCQEAPPVQIKATVLYGAGTGVFSGTGVSSDGLFDPAVSGPGTFTINYLFTTDITKCTYGSSQQITVYPTPKADAGLALHLLQGGNITINATASGVQPLTYKWTLANGSKAIGLDHDDVLTPVASPNDDVTYMLTVTSADGCSASSNVDITVLKAPVVPNTFTPNSDGVNDRWEIKYLDTYPNCSIEIYNRYGEKLYSSIGYPLPWDGTYKGAALPVGTYYYIINPKNGRKVITGSVTIIR